MSGLLAVFKNELVEKRLLVVLGLLGIVPVAIPLVGSWSVGSADDVRAGAAAVLCGVASLLVAVLLGGSVIAADLRERWLGFYFSRPITWWAIWAGKLGAALVLSLGVGALVLLPALVLDPHLGGMKVWAIEAHPFAWTSLLYALAVLLVLVLLLSHAIGVMARARSAWLVLDVAALSAVTLLVWLAFSHLRAAAASMAALWMILGLLPLPLLALLAAGAVQVARGRTDLQRGHRVLSTALWVPLLAGALIAGGWAAFVTTATPADLATVQPAGAAADGEWVGLSGEAAHRAGYQPAFLLHLPSGRFVRLRPGTAGWGREIDFSADGRWAAWQETLDFPTAGPPLLQTLLLDLHRPGALPVATPIFFSGSPNTFTLSPDGKRIATSELAASELAAYGSANISVTAVPDGRILASIPAPGWIPSDGLRFVAGGRLRIYSEELRPIAGEPGWPRRSNLRISELDVASGRLETTGHLASPLGFGRTLSPDGERLLFNDGSGPKSSLHLADAATGAPLALLPQEVGEPPRFLADGRLVQAVKAPGGRQLLLYDRDGRELRRFPFPGVGSLAIGGEVAPHGLAVGTAAGPNALPAGWTAQVLDLATGTAKPLGRGLRPFAWPAATGARPPLFARAAGGLAWLDPAGTLHPLLPRLRPGEGTSR